MMRSVGARMNPSHSTKVLDAFVVVVICMHVVVPVVKPSVVSLL